MKRKALILFLTCFMPLLQAQETSAQPFSHRNSVQLELAGHGLAYSLNYERFLINRPNFKTSAHVGAAYYPPSTGMIDSWFPLMINEMMSFGSHHIEAGLGYVLCREAIRFIEPDNPEWFWSGFYAARVGYRFQKPDGRFLLRASFTPFFEGHLFGDGVYQSHLEMHPSGGLAFGYTF